MFELTTPTSKESLLAALEHLGGEIAGFLDTLPTEEFFAPQGEAWSPAEHARHLSKAVRAVARGLALPKLVLALRFGISLRPSRSFEEIREIYQRALDRGAQAGRFAPSKETAETPPEERRKGILERWRAAGDELARAAGRWSEGALDRYRMPHPILGKLTAREMLCFTLYHNAHHARRVAERRATR